MLYVQLHCILSCMVYCVVCMYKYGYYSILYSKLSFTVNCFSTSTISANEQGVPSESYLQEVREQLEERREEPEESQHQRETRSTSDNTGLYQ